MAQAKAKSNSVVTTAWVGDVLNIDVLGAGSVLFDRTKASADNRDTAEKHGWTQRLCDRAAKAAPSRALGTTDEQWAAIKKAHTLSKFTSIKVIAEYYESGDVAWKMSGGGSEGGMLFEALCEHYEGKKTVEQVRSFLDSRTEEQLKVVRKVPALIEIMNRLRLERMGDSDAGDALAELDA